MSLFGNVDLLVAGILHDIPVYSSLRFDALRGGAPDAGGIWQEWRTVYSYRPIQTFVLLTDALEVLRGAWERQNPTVPFTYRFLEDHLDERMRGHRSFAILLQWLAGFLAIISCLGVFGMASFAVSRRTKEVGVRKVLGASAAIVALLLSS